MRRVALAVVALAAAPTVAAAAGRTEVLVYYTNESAPAGAEARNLEVVTAWFRSSPVPLHHTIAGQLDIDARLSQAAVEINTIEIAHLPFPAVIFSNRLTRAGTCLVVRPDAPPVPHPFTVPPDDHYIVAANPLSKASTLSAALATAAAVFPPDQHDFLLVTQSHGSKVMALTPRLAVRHEETTREELLARATETPPPGPPPAWANTVGVTKPQLLAALADAGRDHAMHFSLVYVEACHTDTPEFARENLPPNVDRLLFIRSGAWRLNVLYLDVQRERRPGETFADALVRTRSSKYVVVERAWPGWAFLRSVPWLYLAPLAVWFLWLADRTRLTRRLRRAAPNPAPPPSNTM